MIPESSNLCNFTIPPSQKALIRQRILQWQNVDMELQKIRLEELPKSNTKSAFKFLEGAVLQNIKRNPPVPYSGLIEQQRLFRRLKQS